VEFRILGPLQVEDDGRIIDLGGPRERVLLARLLTSAGRSWWRLSSAGRLFKQARQY
jgi:hypothetical protein